MMSLILNVVSNALCFIVLLFGTYHAWKTKERTYEASPAWLFISVGLVFLAMYALTNVIEFAGELSGVLLFGEPIGAAMDRTEMALVPAAASFLVAAFMELKRAVVKPI
ncbi:MAG: hypothetical protein QMC77_08830 [Methanocellales archaeon]|nr:hypothetical protein [Methanocellales archaeon]